MKRRSFLKLTAIATLTAPEIIQADLKLLNNKEENLTPAINEKENIDMFITEGDSSYQALTNYKNFDSKYSGGTGFYSPGIRSNATRVIDRGQSFIKMSKILSQKGM